MIKKPKLVGKLAKVPLPNLIFFLVLLFLSSNAYYLFFLPLFLSNMIFSAISGYGVNLFEEGLFFLEFLIPLLSAILLYKIMTRAKTQMQFFLISLVLFIISYAFPFWYTILDTRAIEEMIVYFLFVIFFAYIASFLWKKIIQEKQYAKSYFLLITIVIVFFLNSACLTLDHRLQIS